MERKGKNMRGKYNTDPGKSEDEDTFLFVHREP